MNIQLRAVIYTVGMFALIMSGAFSVVAIANLLGTDAMMVFSILIVAFCVWIMYSIILGKLKIEQHINEIDSKHK
jgi:uncharacterized protein with PQ loop repeat